MMPSEDEINQNIKKLTSHPIFLQAVSTALNLNSYRKIVLNRTLINGWKLLQLPNKRDQERTLHLIHELHHRIAELETKLEAATNKKTSTLSEKPLKKQRSELRSV